MKDFWHDLPRPFFVLAPMEAVTDVVFRHVVARAGAPDVWFSEFTNATGWAHAGDRAIGGRLIKTDDEHPIVAQLWGSDPASMEKLARHCAALGYNGIDINMGCPDSSAVKSGGGAGMILNPENAAAIIAAAKTSGLPVSVKTRLGYSRVDEWREWLTHLLRQDIVNLTIHLRTKKEMSKVPAHFELVGDIKQLRDEIAPGTLLTINGDIRDRAHGMELAEQYGVDGVMIGRGIFANPFAFATSSRPLPSFNTSSTPLASSSILSESPRSIATPRVLSPRPPLKIFRGTEKIFGATPRGATRLSAAPLSSDSTQARVADGGVAPAFSDVIVAKEGADRLTGPVDSDLREDSKGISNDGSGVNSTLEQPLRIEGEGEQGSNAKDGSGVERIDLLRLQLDLYDKYHEQTGRPFETLKRFFKIYIRDFAGASELRDQLMHAKSTDEVRALLP